ncbi:MAG: hypothetical protein II969_01140 [Anaerolineaceae bacterium]|nr:hypothetical protein [Anaerolineaceae bacterium]
MAEKRYITASEIGLYTFCPRAWALKQLDCESDAHWEMEKGKEFHEQIGQREIQREIENQPQQQRINRRIQFITKAIAIVSLCLIITLITFLLK